MSTLKYCWLPLFLVSILLFVLYLSLSVYTFDVVCYLLVFLSFYFFFLFFAMFGTLFSLQDALISLCNNKRIPNGPAFCIKSVGSPSTVSEDLLPFFIFLTAASASLKVNVSLLLCLFRFWDMFLSFFSLLPLWVVIPYPCHFMLCKSILALSFFFILKYCRQSFWLYFLFFQSWQYSLSDPQEQIFITFLLTNI